MSDYIKSNWAVVGRILFDDEDTVMSYSLCTRSEACDQFEEDMIASSGRTREQLMKELNQGDDTFLIINHVLRSDTPIEIESSL